MHDYADARVAQLNLGLKILSGNYLTMGGWLTAALLLLNAGAALATLGAVPHIHHLAALGAVIVSGFVVAFANGRLMRIMAVRQIGFLTVSRDYWSLVASDGARFAAREDMLRLAGRRALHEAIALLVPAILSAGAIAWGYRCFLAVHGAGG